MIKLRKLIKEGLLRQTLPSDPEDLKVLKKVQWKKDTSWKNVPEILTYYKGQLDFKYPEQSYVHTASYVAVLKFQEKIKKYTFKIHLLTGEWEGQLYETIYSVSFKDKEKAKRQFKKLTGIAT